MMSITARCQLNHKSFMQLSKHFTLSEFEKSQTATRKGITNKAGQEKLKT